MIKITARRFTLSDADKTFLEERLEKVSQNLGKRNIEINGRFLVALDKKNKVFEAIWKEGRVTITQKSDDFHKACVEAINNMERFLNDCSDKLINNKRKKGKFFKEKTENDYLEEYSTLTEEENL